MDNQEPEEAQTEPTTDEHSESQTDQEASTPPWECDGVDFDPAKAWNLIQNLRADNAKIKEANDSYKSQLKTYEDEKLSETERLQRDLEEAHQTIANYKKEQAQAVLRDAAAQSIRHPLLNRTPVSGTKRLLSEEDYWLVFQITPPVRGATVRIFIFTIRLPHFNSRTP